MPYFGSSPFDTDVERATSDLKTEEDWALIIDICDKINGSPSGPKDAMKSLMKRLKHSSPRVVMHALALLGACVDNCGKSFQIELCSREFYTFAFNALRKPDAVQVALGARLKELIQDWVIAFEGDTKLGLMKKLYVDLKSEGVTFNDHNADKTIGAGTSNASSNATSRNGTSTSAVSSYQDDIDLARAIEMSLQEASASSAATPTSSGTGDSAIYPSLYPSTSTSAPTPAPTQQSSGRKVRALYDFDAAEDNELSFKAGELINILDDSDENWWRGETLQGKGLFPANFVTSDLNAIPEPVHGSDRKSVRFSDEVAAQPQVEIREEKIALLLEMLHSAAEDNEQEEATIKELERECDAMKPLIKNKIDAIDDERANLMKLNEQFQNALRMYQQLMKEVHVSQPPSTYAYTDGAGQATMYEPTAAYLPPPGAYAPVEPASYQIPGGGQAVSGYAPVGQPPMQMHGGSQPMAPPAQTGALSQGMLPSMHGVSPAVHGMSPAPDQIISATPSQSMLPPNSQSMPGHSQALPPQGQPAPVTSYMAAPPTQSMAYYPVQETPGLPPDAILGSSPGKGMFATPPNQPPVQHYMQEQPVASGPMAIGSQTTVDGPPPPQGYDVPPGTQPMYYYGQPVPAAANPQPVQASLI